ncbi:hypothetical protein HAX54_053457, partial [Datura stramonium]|nr:hypothetical protein [Datura stramonium]
MARTRNSNNNAPTTAIVASSIEPERAKKVVMPPVMGEAFNVVKGAKEMFTTFMANQGQRGDQTPPHIGRRDGSMSFRVKEFINLDPPEFYGTKLEQDTIL